MDHILTSGEKWRWIRIIDRTSEGIEILPTHGPCFFVDDFHRSDCVGIVHENSRYILEGDISRGIKSFDMCVIFEYVLIGLSIAFRKGNTRRYSDSFGTCIEERYSCCELLTSVPPTRIIDGPTITRRESTHRRRRT